MRSVLVAASIAIVLGTAWACLPDLVVQEPSFCGDGYVDPTAGEECDPGAASDAGACVGCAVVCAGEGTFSDPASRHCYFQLGETASSTEATTKCESSGGHVVRLASEKELALVAGKAVTTPFWIGIDRTATAVWSPLETTSEPGWTASCAGCFAQVDAGTIPPDTMAVVPDGPCVIGRGVAESWTQSQCSAKRADFSRQTICEREPLGSRARACGANVCLSVAATEATKRYVLAPTAVVAGDAIAACAAVGGLVAVLGSSEEREQLGAAVAATPGAKTDFWIGLSDTNGTWAWDRAGGMTPPPWGLAEPGEVAGGTGRAYVLVDAQRVDSELAHAGSANDRHAVMCETP